jgi:hypothetical protein
MTQDNKAAAMAASNPFFDLAVAGQSLALGALGAEIQALAALMPGHGATAPAPVDEAQRREEEAAIEAGFDNMPV